MPTNAASSDAGAPNWAAWLDSYEGLPHPVELVPPSPATQPKAEERKPASNPVHRALDQAAQHAPGILLTFAIAWLARTASDVVGRDLLGFSHSPVAPAAIAVAMGMLLRNTAGLPSAYASGIAISGRLLLRAGIVLLGLRLSLPAVGWIGLHALPLVVACVLVAIGGVALLARLLDLPRRQAMLIAVGTGICGVSAISAVAPILKADDDEVSYSIACITLFGVACMFTYPWLAHALFAGDARMAGFFLGTAIHDTAQVTGAAIMYRQQFDALETLDVATVTKLVRNTLMVVVIPIAGYLAHASQHGASGRQFRLHQAIPTFVLAYVAMAALRSLGDWGGQPFGVLTKEAWRSALSLADSAAAWLLTSATAAIGLGTQFSRLKRLGWRPFVTGFAAASAVGAFSLLALRLLPPMR